MTTAARAIWQYWLPKAWRHSDAHRAKMEWLIRLRWLAIFFQSLSLIPALVFRYLDPRFFYDYAGTVFFLIAFNAFSTLLLRKKRALTPNDLFLQLLIDLAGLSILLLLTGGALNPFSPLLFLHAGLGAMILTGWRGNIFFAFLAGCMGILYWVPRLPTALKYGHTPRSVVFLSCLATAFASWRLMAWLSGTLVSLQAHVTILKERKERMDHLRALGALASGFSHEFATPLNTLQMRLNRLKRKTGLAQDADLRVALEAVEQCALALRSLNDHRVQPGHLSMSTASFSKTIRSIVKNWEKENPEVAVSLQDPSNETPQEAELLLPQAAFSQVLLNLLDNAAQACAKPGRAADGRINIDVFSEISGHRFRVRDNGGGVSDLVFRQWGEPFVTTKESGTGLGIYNALTLAQAMGGDFSLKNLPEGGACADFFLPRAES